jgi:hypothetical protein
MTSQLPTFNEQSPDLRMRYHAYDIASGVCVATCDYLSSLCGRLTYVERPAHIYPWRVEWSDGVFICQDSGIRLEDRYPSLPGIDMPPPYIRVAHNRYA